jgi:hypothetical protein
LKISDVRFFQLSLHYSDLVRLMILVRLQYDTCTDFIMILVQTSYYQTSLVPLLLLAGCLPLQSHLFNSSLCLLSLCLLMSFRIFSCSHSETLKSATYMYLFMLLAIAITLLHTPSWCLFILTHCSGTLFDVTTVLAAFAFSLMQFSPLSAMLSLVFAFQRLCLFPFTLCGPGLPNVNHLSSTFVYSLMMTLPVETSSSK